MRNSSLFDFVQYSAGKLELFLLVIVRASGLFIIAPILSQQAFPKPLKVAFAIMLSIIVMMTLPAVDLSPSQSLIGLVGVIFTELFVGALIGFFFLLLLLAAQGAGSIVGYQVGLSLANEFDPSTQTQSSVIGTFWFLLGSLFFLAINGHHLIIQAFHESYALISPGRVTMNGSVGEMMITSTAYLFIIALKIAAPVMVTLFLVDVALGTVAKMMPTMNVFFVGFPVKIGVGFAVIALSLPIFTYVLQKSLGYLNTELGYVLAALAKA